MCAADSGPPGSLADLRRDEYTGVNRCWPCTALNTALLAVASVTVGWAIAPLAGAAVAAAGLAAIWLRGYLVPYTPRITRRLLPLLPGERFGHAVPPAAPAEPTATAGAETPATDGAGESPRASDAVPAVSGEGVSAGRTDDASGTDVVEALLAADVLVADGGALTLDPDFHDAWRAAIADSRSAESAPDALADALVAAIPWVADAAVVRDGGRQWIQLTDADARLAAETWLSLPAAAADLTAVRTLAARTDLDARRRTLAAPPLRQFLERCPRCDAELDVSSPRACCGSPRYVAEGIEAVLACPDCDELVTVFKGESGGD